MSLAPSNTVKFGVLQFILDRHERHHHPRVFPRIHHINECAFQD
jgi:hypothetical protein